jgi:hypothetical protein
MKKIMFSAVALIAFSFAGMANTGGEEKLNNEELKTEIQESDNDSNKKSCGLQYLEDFERLENAGLTFEAAGAIAFHYLNKCLGIE